MKFTALKMFVCYFLFHQSQNLEVHCSSTAAAVSLARRTRDEYCVEEHTKKEVMAAESSYTTWLVLPAGIYLQNVGRNNGNFTQITACKEEKNESE